jgi:SSS family solute:Na+ symporter
VTIGIFTAFIASGFENISNYLQVLFSFFNVPLFAAFIIGMFWKRASARSGFWGILVGTIAAVSVYTLYKVDILSFRSDLQETFWGSIVAFFAGGLAIVIASSRQTPKTDEELNGLVYGMAIEDLEAADVPWFRNPVITGGTIFVLSIALYFVVAAL